TRVDGVARALRGDDDPRRRPRSLDARLPVRQGSVRVREAFVKVRFRREASGILQVHPQANGGLKMKRFLRVPVAAAVASLVVASAASAVTAKSAVAPISA